MKSAEKILKQIRKFDKDKSLVTKLITETNALTLDGYEINVYTTPKKEIIYIQVYTISGNFKYYPDTIKLEFDERSGMFSVSKHLIRISEFMVLTEAMLDRDKERKILCEDLLESLL